MFVLRLLLMLVVTGERYCTIPFHRRKLFREEFNRNDDNAMWNDAYFDRLFGIEKRAELPAPVNDDSEEADEEPEEEEEYDTEDDAEYDTNDEDPELRFGRSAGKRFSRNEKFDYENPYAAKRDREKFKREYIVRSDDEDCDDGATETLQYFDYDPSEPRQAGEDEFDMSSGISQYYRGVSDRIKIIVAACFLYLVG